MSPENPEMIRPFPREPLLERFCNFERLLEMLELWNLDGLVLSSEKNVFYLSGFNPIAHKGDEPRPYALILSDSNRNTRSCWWQITTSGILLRNRVGSRTSVRSVP